MAETNWKALKDSTIDVAVLPWGATEAHNFHLPYGTDIIESDHLAAESARIAHESGARLIVLPTVPFGVNTGQSDIFLDINLNPTTQLAILKDILEVLDRQGIHKLVIFNSHGGNDFKAIVRELGLKFPGMFICLLNWFQMAEKSDYFDEPGDHAGEMETSLMLFLKPELVLSKAQWGVGREKQNKIEAFREGWVWAERRWSQISEDTGVGNPAAASKEKGELFFKAVTQKAGRFLISLCETDVKDLYE